jgi:hypothetical protein
MDTGYDEQSTSARLKGARILSGPLGGRTALAASLIDAWRAPVSSWSPMYVAHPRAILRPSPAANVNLDVDSGAGRDDAMHAANTLRPTCASCV